MRIDFLRCIREFQSITMLKVTLVWCDGNTTDFEFHIPVNAASPRS